MPSAGKDADIPLTGCSCVLTSHRSVIDVDQVMAGHARGTDMRIRFRARLPGTAVRSWRLAVELGNIEKWDADKYRKNSDKLLPITGV